MNYANILIVGNELRTNALIEGTLRSGGYGYPVLTHSADDALKKAEKNHFDLALVDIDGSEKINGLAAGEKLRSKFQVPVIFLTDSTDEHMLRKANITEPSGCLLKPVNLLELQAMVELVLYKHRMERIIKEKESRFRLMYEEAPLGYVVLDSGGFIIDVNRSWVEFCQYAREELHGRSFSSFLVPESSKAFREQYDDFEKLIESNRLELGILLKNGRTAVILFQGKAIRDRTGVFQRAHCIAWDITEKKHHEQEREELVRQLRKALDNIKTLEGILPMCAGCKKIRDADNNWVSLEKYILEHSSAEAISHGICPECKKKLYPEIS